MEYRLREHTADVAVEARGGSLDAVFAAVAKGFVEASCEEVPAGGETFTMDVESESLEALLFDYLDELIYQRDVRDVMPVDHETTVTENNGTFRVQATARGVPLDRIDAREIKAVTYSEMRLEHVDGSWESYVVFDV